MTPDNLISPSEIERRTGVSATRIRQWELRLGWPLSVRSPHGHRRYPASIIPDIREAQRRIDCGRSMRDEIVDGQPVWIHQVVVRQQRRDLRSIDALPIPRTDAGLRLRSVLVDALGRNDEAGVAAAVAQLPMVRPDDREAAAIGILRHLDHPAARAMAAAQPTVPVAPDPHRTPGSAPPDPSERAAQIADPEHLVTQTPPEPEVGAAPAPRRTPPTPDPALSRRGNPDISPRPGRRNPDATPRSQSVRPKSSPVPSSAPRSTERRSAKRHTPPARISIVATRWRQLRTMIRQAEVLLMDPLACAIHRGSARQRRIIAALLPHLQGRANVHRWKRGASRHHLREA